MATITIDGDDVMLTFTRFERLLGLIHDQRIPLRSITEVTQVPVGLTATEGWRAPGFGVPGRSKIGTWRGAGRKMLVRVQRDQPAVRIDADGQRYHAYLIGADDAIGSADAISACLPTS
jgi:hypothetical protein